MRCAILVACMAILTVDSIVMAQVAVFAAEDGCWGHSIFCTAMCFIATWHALKAYATLRIERESLDAGVTHWDRRVFEER